MIKIKNQWKIVLAIFSLIVLSSVELHQRFGSWDSNLNCIELVTDSEEEIADESHNFGWEWFSIYSDLSNVKLQTIVRFRSVRLFSFVADTYRSCPRYIQFEQLRVFG